MRNLRSMIKVAYGKGYVEPEPKKDSFTPYEYGVELASNMVHITVVNALKFFFFAKPRTDAEIIEFLDGIYSVKGRN